MMKLVIPSLVITFILSSCKNEKHQKTKEESFKTIKMKTAYIGTYTKKEGHVNGQAEGIYTIHQDPESGNLQTGKTVAKITNPSFVKASGDGRFLFAVSELGEDDAESGFVYSYRINKDESLEEINKVSTEAFAPCHIKIDKTGEYVFVANYTGGVVMLYERKPGGSLEKKQRIDLENPKESHAHSVNISADNNYVYIADLGNDKVWIFKFNSEEGKLTPHEQPFVALEAGAGPRHFTFSGAEDFAYSINELNSSVSVFKVLKGGGLKVIQNISTLPEDFSGDNSAGDIHLHPSGKFLYASNRGHNSIAAFRVDKESGDLTSIGFTSTQGETPRNFSVAADGKFLYAANQDSNNIIILKISTESGELSPHSDPITAKSPVCIEFVD